MDSHQKQLANISHHRFDSWSQDLMDTPFTFDPWQIAQVGENNDGVYRQEYSKLPITENHEPLVNAADYGLIAKDYYLNVLWDHANQKEHQLELDTSLLFPTAWVRQTVAQKLQKIDSLLRQHDLFVIINSAWRHPQVQDLANTLMSAEFGQKYLAKTLAPATISPHMTGGAVDLELWSLQTSKPLSYSYPGDQINAFVVEKSPSSPRRDIRRILFHLCVQEGLTVHPGEFWHFGFGDPLSAYLTHQPHAAYGFTTPPADSQLHGH